MKVPSAVAKTAFVVGLVGMIPAAVGGAKLGKLHDPDGNVQIKYESPTHALGGGLLTAGGLAATATAAYDTSLLGPTLRKTAIGALAPIVAGLGAGYLMVHPKDDPTADQYRMENGGTWPPK